MRRLKDEISEKRHQIRVLEQRMIGSVEKTPYTSNNTQMSQVSMHQVWVGYWPKKVIDPSGQKCIILY